MANLNRIVLLGHLQENPETRISMEGISMCRFPMLISNFQGAKNKSRVDVVAWRKLAEICGQILKKGSLALIEGRLQVRSYEDKSGQRKWVTEVVASNMQKVDPRTQGPLPQAQKEAPHEQEEADTEEASGFEEVEELGEDDLPF